MLRLPRYLTNVQRENRVEQLLDIVTEYFQLFSICLFSIAQSTKSTKHNDRPARSH